MDRTLRAAVAAGLLGFVTVAGLGVFLGFPTRGSVITGLVVAVLAGGLLLGVGRRAETFHPTDPTAHLADHRPPPGEPTDLDHPDDPDPGATRG
jgi:hypothetical protein